MHRSLGNSLFCGFSWRGSCHHQCAKRQSCGESTTPWRWPTSGRRGASGEGLSSREPRGSSFSPTSVNCVCSLPTYHQRRTSRQVQPRGSSWSRTGTLPPGFFTPDRSLCISPIGADEALLLLKRRGRPRRHRRTQPEVGTSSWPSSSLPFPSSRGL
jgi:hypothetical protein